MVLLTSPQDHPFAASRTANSGCGRSPRDSHVHNAPKTDARCDSRLDCRWSVRSTRSGRSRLSTGRRGLRALPAPGRHRTRCCDVFHASICATQCALKESLRTGHPVVCRPFIVEAGWSPDFMNVSATALKDETARNRRVELFRGLSVIEELQKELLDKYTVADIVSRSQGDASSLSMPCRNSRGSGMPSSSRRLQRTRRSWWPSSPPRFLRSMKRFVAVNCGLFRSTAQVELFGYTAPGERS